MKILAGVLLGVVVLISVCAYTQTAMSDCPTAQPDVVCPMHRIEGLSNWQYAVLLSRRVLELTAVSLVVLGAWFLWIGGLRERAFQAWQAFYRRLYLPHLPSSPVQAFLAQGILHPKIY